MSRPRARRALRRALPFAGSLAALLAATACTSGDGISAADSGGPSLITVVRPADRKAAPDISGRTVDGGQAGLAAYRGKVVVINMWSSTCGPCRAEAPNLAAVATADQAKGVRFLGINTRDQDTTGPVQFDKTYKITYPSLFDPYGKQILRFPKGSLNPQVLPATLVVDRQGRLAALAQKSLSEEELHQIVDPIAAEA